MMTSNNWTTIHPSTRVLCTLALTTAMLGGGWGDVWAADNIWTRGAGSLDWNVDGNWNQGGVPQADPYEEEGIIENGDTVFLSTSTIDPAGIVLGRTAATFGGLEIRSGGTIHVVDSSGTPNGTVSVGVAGSGSLAIQPGGTMTAQFLNVNGPSSLTIGGTGGVATLGVTNAANLNGTTHITGAGHSISTGSVTFGGTSALVEDIRSAIHSPVRAAGVAALGGQFSVQFGGGYVPAVGTSWDIVDAAGIAGQFSSVDLSAGPTLGPGQVFRLARRAGGVNGQLLQLQYRNVLTLNVDWNTKAVSISSPSGEAIAIDGYSVLSASGGLSVGQWNSFQDQTLSGWAEAAPTSNALNELNTNVGGILSINSTAKGIGTPFNPVFGPLGQSPEDLRFEYTLPSTGETIEGIVNYTGNRLVNNLLLTVDPASGQAQLKNSSPNPLSFDGYSILSASNSLLPSNGNWLSLADQAQTGWQESNATTGALNELRTSGFTTLNSGQSLYLGGLFNKVSGQKDLVLEFSLQGETGGRTGAVIYAALSANVPGDYNGNGVVDAADYTIWRDTLGSTTDLRANGDNTGASANKIDAADYAFWKSHFGNTSGAGGGSLGSAAVPEPAAWLLVAMALLTFSVQRPNRME